MELYKYLFTMQAYSFKEKKMDQTKEKSENSTSFMRRLEGISMEIFKVAFLMSIHFMGIGISSGADARPKSLKGISGGGHEKSKSEVGSPDLGFSQTIPDRRDFPVDDQVDPCADFHKYVCNKVESSFKLRPDRSRHTFAFNDSVERLLEAKKTFFKNIDQEKNLGVRGEGLKNYYQACMNEKAGIVDEKRFLKDLNSQAEKLKSTEDFAKLMVQNLAEGRYSVLGVGNDENKDDSSKYDFNIGANFMLLPDHSYYENAELMVSYRQIIIEYFHTLFPKWSKSVLNKKADNIISLQRDFIKVYPQKAERRQRYSERHQMTQDEFATKYASLQLKSLIGKLQKTTLLQIPIPESLNFYLQQIKSGQTQRLRDFYHFVSLYNVIDDSYPKLFAKRFAFNNKYFGGPEKRSVRQERCTMAMMGTFEKELDEVLLPRIFPHFPEEKLMTVANTIRQSILSGLEKNEWLSTMARREAIKKITVAKLQLVRPLNDQEWDFLPILKYSNTKPIENGMLLEKALYIKMLKENAEPVFPDKWLMGPLTVNAYYNPSQNRFVLPAGILQYPFFDAEGGVLENLGGVGAVIGHELGHGIDDMGSKFDEKGSLRQWMTEKDLVTFKERGKKLVDQFNKIGHDGSLTLGENTADLVGLTFAYNAAFPKGQGTIDDKRKFFQSYARLWCNVTLPKMEEKQLKTDPHALGWARINEQVKHQSGFEEAYSCKAGSAMTLPASERVQIW